MNYHYDKTTKEFLHETNGRLDPLEAERRKALIEKGAPKSKVPAQVYLKPAFSTLLMAF